MPIAINRDVFSALQALQGTQRSDGLVSSAVSPLKAPPASTPYFGQPADSMSQAGSAMQSDGQAMADVKVFRSTVSLAQVDPPQTAANPFAMRAGLFSGDGVPQAYKYAGSKEALGLSQLQMDNLTPVSVRKLFAG